MEHRVTDIGSKRYRWLYQLRLFKNPVFFLLLLKIFFCIWLVISLFVLSLDLVEGLPAKTLEGTLLFMLLMGLILLLLLIVSYGFYALIMRGRYTILFEMDEKGIAHIQVPADAKKAETFGLATFLAGLLTGNPNVMGAGLLSAHKQASYTKFKAVNKIRINRKRQQIKIRSSGLFHNQVFTHPDDFDFVLNFIRSHLSDKKASE